MLRVVLSTSSFTYRLLVQSVLTSFKFDRYRHWSFSKMWTGIRTRPVQGSGVEFTSSSLLFSWFSKSQFQIIFISHFFIPLCQQFVCDFLCYRLKKSEIVLGMAVVAALIGVTLIGLYSWSIDMYQPLIADCNDFLYSLLKLCELGSATI
jgi:hypothetical protein